MILSVASWGREELIGRRRIGLWWWSSNSGPATSRVLWYQAVSVSTGIDQADIKGIFCFRDLFTTILLDTLSEKGKAVSLSALPEEEK